jgi:hypothetical protein
VVTGAVLKRMRPETFAGIWVAVLLLSACAKMRSVSVEGSVAVPGRPVKTRSSVRNGGAGGADLGMNWDEWIVPWKPGLVLRLTC